jgi:phage tail protein X
MTAHRGRQSDPVDRFVWHVFGQMDGISSAG